MEIDNDFIINLRKTIGVTQKTFAEMLGVSFYTIRNLEQKQIDVPKSVINAILKQFPNYIKGDNESNTVAIPFYYVKASAGEGTMLQDYPAKDCIEFDKRLLQVIIGRKPEHLSLIQAEGDSMIPDIQDGDILLIDDSIKEIIPNKTFVIRQDNQLRVKKLKTELNGNILIISNNSEKYPVEVMNTNTQIIGQVIWNGNKALL